MNVLRSHKYKPWAIVLANRFSIESKNNNNQFTVIYCILFMQSYNIGCINVSLQKICVTFFLKFNLIHVA